ncbi:protein FAM234B isoform X5 [Molossus molossus]|uniref:protein FAM234B isoform X5 n=1 Tax=Molossus molossus TaxID=27622 RepID=UPI0017475D15|nr:protein FAM234B isoform X5 [Molossus molossus]
MATVLSRALKLPGKKSPDLGEYDPLTQADSDESEDDLVLDLQQKNGGVKNGTSPLGEAPEPDSDAEVAGPAKPHLSEVTTERYPVEPLGGLEQKAASSIVSYVRTSVFLLTLVVSMVLVLVCAFLIPCPPRDLHSTWSRHLGPQGGGDLSPLELADVNGDGLRDVLLSFVTSRNGSAVGKAIWTLNSNYLSNGTLAAPGVVLPDVDEDGVRDLVVLAVGEPQPDLCFLLVSGRTGRPVGRPVKYNVVGVGNLIGPQVYVTANGAVYILFGFGNIQAVALRDLFVQAQNRDSSPPSLQIEEPEWEKRRSINLSELIDIYSDGVELLQMVKAPDSNCSNLLITTSQVLVLLRGQNLTPYWTLRLPGLHSQPTPGYFTDDQTLDFLLQIQDGVGMKKMMVVDGNSGSVVWSYSAPCHMERSPTTSAVTSDQKSVFLFWAEGLSATPPNSDVILGTEPPGLHHLYLLHPAFPSILLDLANATGTVTASEVGINDLWKDAFYVTRTTGPSSRGHPAPLVVSKLSLRWALMEGQMVQLKETTPKIGRGELRRFLSRIKFVDSPLQI